MCGGGSEWPCWEGREGEGGGGSDVLGGEGGAERACWEEREGEVRVNTRFLPTPSCVIGAGRRSRRRRAGGGCRSTR